MRGSCKPSAAGQEVVRAACLGTSHCQTLEHAVRDRRVARQLAGILHRMWVDETDFHVGFGAKVTQRVRLKPAR